MCRDCGCSPGSAPDDHHHHHGDHEHAHEGGNVPHHHHHDHDHHHPHDHAGGRPTGQSRVLDLHQSLLAKNDHLAGHNRERFASGHLLTLNLLSSPGSGKTKLLERTLTDLRDQLRMGVIVGDLQTDNDAQRLRNRGAPVVPITTGNVCHLEAAMVARACDHLDLDTLDVLFIENVGNLVCPAAFDLGEEQRIVVLSTTEGEDKPLKYPEAFKSAQVILLNKIDIAEAAGFDRATALENIRRISPHAAIFEVSARTGQGMENWYRLLQEQVRQRLSKFAATAPH